LKFAGFLVMGRDVRAVINGVAFSPGDSKRIKLRDKTVLVRCLQVGSTNVVIETDQSSRPTTLKIGEER